MAKPITEPGSDPSEPRQPLALVEDHVVDYAAVDEGCVDRARHMFCDHRHVYHHHVYHAAPDGQKQQDPVASTQRSGPRHAPLAL